MAQGIKLTDKIISNGIEYAITTKHPIYHLRYTIMTRCYNAAPRDYRFYQGRGIEVCDEWKNSYINFFQWCMDNGWRRGLVLDRINNNGNYEPNNCKFITATENLKKMHKDNKMSGENAPHAKLTLIQVNEIRRRLNDGVTCSRLGRDYGVSKSTIQAIKIGQNWKE